MTQTLRIFAPVVAAAALVLGALPAGAAIAAAAASPASRHRPPAETLAHGRYAVAVADYTLGDSAFRTPDAYRENGDPKSGLAPVELTGRVYYPRTRAHRPRPMVIMLHGSWWTCADRRASAALDGALAEQDAWTAAHPPTQPPGGGKPVGQPNPDQPRLDRIIDAAAAALGGWPCAKHTPALPSYTGYDYLGRSLASHGITTVSISANGINAVDLYSNEARGRLIDKHLAMWATLDRSGGGPLAGHFTRPGTRQPVHPDFRHTIDLQRIGTLGHSRGGRAVFWQAADTHRSLLPSGVRIAATAALAPAGISEPGSPDNVDFLVTRVPVLLWEGTCDNATGREGDDFVRLVADSPHRPYYRVLVHGANHNFLNTQWSPSSGQVRAEDDALDAPGPRPGTCADPDGAVQSKLGETLERATGRAYVTAFFLRELMGRRQWQPVLTGRVKPLGDRVRVDVAVNPTVDPTADGS